MKVLNLYAGIGGNRKLWGDVMDVDGTAVEIKNSIADVYQRNFPKDKVIVGDAHQYLLDNVHKDWDFIWASPPCPTHSRFGFMGMKNRVGYKKGNRDSKERSKDLEYPDMKLYQEVIFLDNFFDGKWVVENTYSYYDPLIKPQKRHRHFFWSNFFIMEFEKEGANAVSVNSIKEKEKKVGFNLDGCKFDDMDGTHKKDKVLNNCVNSELGKHVLECAFKNKQITLDEITSEDW